jgi:hypothetical protein
MTAVAASPPTQPESQPVPDLTSTEPEPEPVSLPEPAPDPTAENEALAAHNQAIMIAKAPRSSRCCQRMPQGAGERTRGRGTRTRGSRQRVQENQIPFEAHDCSHQKMLADSLSRYYTGSSRPTQDVLPAGPMELPLRHRERRASAIIRPHTKARANPRQPPAAPVQHSL